MSAPAPTRLVPPRPNLGPEPWAGSVQLVPLIALIGGLVFLFGCALFLRRALRRPKRSTGGSLPAADPGEVSPRDELLTLSASIRNALTQELGTAWRAKTTEEVSADARLEELIGAEHLQELGRFLDYVDHLKFAPESSNHHEEVLEQALLSWRPRVSILTTEIQTKPKGRLNSHGSLAAPDRRAANKVVSGR